MSKNIAINLKKSIISAGEQVNCTIYTNILKDGRSPKLIFKGTEFVEFDQHDYTPKSIKKWKIRRIKKEVDIIKKSITLGKDLKKGEYSFPISFIIPSEAPSSLEFNDPKFNRSCFIKYKLIAKSGKEEFEKPLTIFNKKIPEISNLGHGNQTSKKVNSCLCCGNGGTVAITIDMANSKKDFYHPGDKVKILADVDTTNSKIDIKNLKGSVNLEISFDADQGHNAYTKPCGIISAGEIKKGEKTSIPLVFTLDSPENVASSAGMMITSIYSLRIQAEMDAFNCGCAPGPNFTLAVVISRKEEEGKEGEEREWNPKKMGLKNFNLEMSEEFRPVILQHLEKSRAVLGGKSGGNDGGNYDLDNSRMNMVHPATVKVNRSQRR